MKQHANCEVPPTAGLPTRWADWWPWGKRAALQPAGAGPAQLECSGTAALVVALRSLQQVSARTDVIVPAYTCPLVAIAINECGLRVRVCDTRRGHFDMDPDALAAMCDAHTLAVMPTHLAGRIADVAHAIACAQAAGAWVIEDAAQAWGASIDCKPVGTLGDIGFFSMAVGKGITTYEGGVLVAREAAMRDRLRAVSRATISRHVGWEALRLAQLFAYTLVYRPFALRWVYAWPRRRALARGDWIAAVGDAFAAPIALHRMSRWRLSIGARAARRWPAFAAQLRAQAQRRIPMLERIAGVQVIQDSQGADGAWPFLLLRLPDQRTRDAILDELATSHFGVSRLFVHALPDYDYLHLDVADVANAREFAACTLTISNSPWLDEQAFEQLAKRIENIMCDVNATPAAPATAY